MRRVGARPERRADVLQIVTNGAAPVRRRLRLVPLRRTEVEARIPVLLGAARDADLGVEDQQQVVLDLLHEPRFADQAPAEVYAILLDEGVVLASDSRTNAGIDSISTFRKMHVLERRGERFFALLDERQALEGEANRLRATGARLRIDDHRPVELLLQAVGQHARQVGAVTRPQGGRRRQGHEQRVVRLHQLEQARPARRLRHPRARSCPACARCLRTAPTFRNPYRGRTANILSIR